MKLVDLIIVFAAVKAIMLSNQLKNVGRLRSYCFVYLHYYFWGLLNSKSGIPCRM